MSTDIGILPAGLNILFAVYNKIQEDAQRVYQHFIILLLTRLDLPYRNLGTALLQLLQGYNNIPDAISQVVTMAVTLARMQLHATLRNIIRDIKALYNTLQSIPRLIVTMQFIDGHTITRSFQ